MQQKGQVCSLAVLDQETIPGKRHHKDRLKVKLRGGERKQRGRDANGGLVRRRSVSSKFSMRVLKREGQRLVSTSITRGGSYSMC